MAYTGCGSSVCYIITCGLCGSFGNDPSDDEVHVSQREPLISHDPRARTSFASQSNHDTVEPKPRVKRPVSTSNILGLGIRDVNVDYELGSLLGEGAFGVVRRCKHRKTGQEFACKTVEKSQLRRRADVEDVRREVQILMMLSSHPNIAALLAIYEDDEAVHLILELCEGGQLFDEICALGTISERTIARFFHKMVEVVDYCHTLGIAHRDIKPENFLLSKRGPGGQVKAADFGLSQFFRPGKPFTSLVGSAYFVAPEVLLREYGPKADIWSLGVCLYILLTGLIPFWGTTEEEIFRMVLHADIDFESSPWPQLSRPAKDIVRKMLQRDPSKRPSAAQLLQHAWLCQAAPDTPLSDEVVIRIKEFAAMTKVKRAAMLMAAQGLEDNPQLNALMDKLEAAEVVEGAGVTAEDARKVVGDGVAEVIGTLSMRENPKGGGGGGGGGGNRSVQSTTPAELVAATLGLVPQCKDELIKNLFDKFDASGQGLVSQEELYAVLQKYGISQEDVANVVAAVDADHDGKLNLSEFGVLMARNTDSLQQAVRRRWHVVESPQKRLGTVTETDDWQGS